MPSMKRIASFLLTVGAGTSIWAQNVICSGAEIYSKQSVKYGRWETRMQTAATPGTVSSFFTYYDNSSNQGEPWREIDIEVLGSKPNGFQSNVILASGSNLYRNFHTQSNDLSKGFHTYNLTWTPDSVVWRLDGALVRKETRTAVLPPLQEKNQSYRMNLWSSTSVDWVGSLDLSKLPIYQVVNWMRYSAYTPGAGPDKSNFTESWVDDFTSFNSVRWSKGDWTFETNQAKFSPTNLSIRDGYLVLALTRPDQEGIKQSFPTDPQGNAYSTASVADHAAAPALKAWATSTGIRIEGARSPVRVMDAHGRLLAQARPGEAQIPLQARGVLFVQAGERTASVVR